MTSKVILFLVALLTLAAGQQGTIQVTPITATLFTESQYQLSYYTFHDLPNSAVFELDLSNTYIEVPDAALNTSATVQGSSVSGATATCISKKCTLRLNNPVPRFSNLTIVFGSLKNPYFLLSQPTSTKITFNTSYIENLSYNIPSSKYTPLSMTLNSMQQSNYGVGNTDVTYTFNLSIPMTPTNPQLSVTIPDQVQTNNLVTSLSYYNSIQNNPPFIVNKNILFVVSATDNNQTGILYLTLSGLVNPKSIGSSSSFTVSLQLSALPGSTSSCQGCTVAIINSGLLAKSTVPGDILTISLSSSNPSISQQTNITIYNQLFASIPQGGKYQLTLPASVQPKLPIYCNSNHGFTITSSSPSCSYNATSHTISTDNFHFSGTGGAVFTTTVINPPDTRRADYTFQTFDSQGNMIGNSSQYASLQALPLVLTATASKTAAQVDTNYKLSVNLTLGVALTASDKINVILPFASYSTSGIQCYSAGVSFSCSTSTDPVTSNLTVSMAPPCSNCGQGSSISFSIDGLTNPSFISSYSQSIVVQTAHPEGVVEQLAIISSLTASTVTINNYSRNGNAEVGSSYTLAFQHSIPPYVSSNGGILLLKFTAFDSYVPVVYGQNSYTYPTSLAVTDGNGNSYSNTVAYDTSNTPNYVSQISIEICGSNPCNGKINIVGLVRGYYTLSSSTQNVQITTTGLNSIATNSIPVTAYTPTKANNQLGLTLSNSVTTLTSSYVFTMNSVKIPIQNNITFSLSSMHTINAGCFAVQNSTLFTGVLTCSVNNNQVTVAISGDTTPMMVQNINYQITLTNVTNPATIQPLTYSLTTQFNNQNSQIYSTSYSIKNPLPLTFSYDRSNSTYAQSAIMTLTLTSSYLTFDEIKLRIPSDLMTISSSNDYSFSLDNSTFEVTQIYSLSNKSLSVNIVNPASTSITGLVEMNMYIGGYLTAQGSTNIAAVGPVYLANTATTTSRVVGDSTQLTVLVNRVNPFSAQTSFVLELSNTLFDLTNAKYNNAPLTLPLTVPISTTTIVIRNLTNLLSVPSTPLFSGLKIYSVDSNNAKVAKTNFNASSLNPNTPATGLSYSFVRSNTAIGGTGNLTITYTAKLPGSASTMTIDLPQKQMTMASSACQMQIGATLSACQVISNNSSSITISYQNQSKVILNNVVNQEPNTNELSVILQNSQSELVQKSTAAITPAIKLDSMSVNGSVSNTNVATNSLLTFSIRSASDIVSSSKIVINIPVMSYSRISQLVSQDCSYSIAGVNYNGCSFGLDNSGEWLTQVNLTNLGSSQISANTIIALNLTLTNAWTDKPFDSNVITFRVCSAADAYLSQGTILMSTLNNDNSFTPTPINNLMVTESVSVAGSSNNNVSLSFNLSVPIPVNTVFHVMLPKSSYSMDLSAVSASISPSSTSEDSTYYMLQFTTGCDQTSPLCRTANNQYSLSVMVSNQPYLQIAQNPLTVQVRRSDNGLSSTASYDVPLHTAAAVSGAQISRTYMQANQDTTVVFMFNHTGLSEFTVVISPMSTPVGQVPLLTSLTTTTLTSSGETLSSSINSTYHISVSLVNLTTSQSTISIHGTNPFLIPSDPESYMVTIMDATHIYFQSTVTPIDHLIAYSANVNLHRVVTTVAQSTEVYLNGVFPDTVNDMFVQFGGSNFSVSGKSFNVSLGHTFNPDNVSDVSTTDIVIRNTHLVAFSASLTYTPALTPQNLTAFTSLSIDNTLNVSQDTNISVALNNYEVSTLSVSTPVFYATLNTCCIDAECSQTNIQSCTLDQQATQNIISVILASPQKITQAYFTVTTLEYQASFSNKVAKVVTGLPSAQFDIPLSIQVVATPLVSTLTLGSWMVNQINRYDLYIQTANRKGYLGIGLPSYAVSQLSTNYQGSDYHLMVDGNTYALSLDIAAAYTFVIPVLASTSNISLVLKNITNPPNNEPFPLTIHQAVDSSFSQIYAKKEYTISMALFDPITAHSAIRNDTKVGTPVTLTLNITAPAYTDQMVIKFPSSQLKTETTCHVFANSQNVPCSVINSSAILTDNIAGNGEYVITGLTNQLYFSSSAQYDQLAINIGYPYTRASTTSMTSTHITPILTLGTITLNSATSTTTTLLTATNLVYNFTIENINNITGFIVSYGTYFYHLPSTIQCRINGVINNCVKQDSVTLFLPLENSLSSHDIVVNINGIVNYIRPDNWTIKSVQTVTPGTYSDVDVYLGQSNTVGSMGAGSLSTRILFPNNYAQNQPVTLKIMVDSQFKNVPVSNLKLNVSIPEGNCQFLGQDYQTEITMTCTFPIQTTASVSVSLYHPLFTSTTLAAAQVSLPILASPSSSCSNQMCDSCSPYNGQQYCFQCRQGLYSSNGQCVESCTAGSHPYADSGICQPCYPSCSECFSHTMNDCLSCQDPLLVVSSGSCQQSCPVSQFSYLGYCVQNEECQNADGCRICSGNGFCYECLPNYDGQPTCAYQSPLPPVFFTYLLIPFLLTGIVMLIVTAARCGGGDSFLSQWIFSFSFIELFAWILTVPIMPDIFTSMLMLSLLALRIIISIVGYEVYYRHNLGELSEKLLEDQSHKQSQKSQKKLQDNTQNNSVDNFKTKFARFVAHFNGPDAYELLKSRIAEPILSVNHHIAVHILFMINRWIVGILMVYLCTVASFGDSLIMPVMVLLSSISVSMARVMTIDKVRACFNRCRSS